MADYRLYCLDGEGHIGLADWIEAEDDDAAISEARTLRPDVHKCEIWQKNRFVAKVNHQGHVERPAAQPLSWDRNFTHPSG